MRTEEIVSRLLYRDALMLVIDKPAGLPVHPGPGGGETLVHHLDALRFGLPRRPEAAHRLDRDTSGCLVLGRHPKALARLGELFRTSRVDKAYWAVVEGGPAEEEGEIALSIGPQSADRPWWMKVDPAGQAALTRWRVLGRGADRPSPPLRGRAGEGDMARPLIESAALDPHVFGLTLLELRPVTGRTHQLRVHCAAMGWPILGDTLYGTSPRQGGPELHLHARSVTVPLYPKRPAILAEAPVPAHMQERIEALAVIPDSAADPGSCRE